MKKQRCLRVSLLIVVYLTLNVYVASRVYQPNYFVPIVLTILAFIPPTVWVYLKEPFKKIPELQRMSQVIGFFKLVTMICFIISAISTRTIAEALGGWALIPVNVFGVIVCLLNPTGSCK